MDGGGCTGAMLVWMYRSYVSVDGGGCTGAMLVWMVVSLQELC